MDKTPDPPLKIVTLAEANGLLPRVIPLVEQLRSLQRSITDTNKKLEAVVEKLSAGNGYPIQSLKDELEALTRHQLQLIEAFQSALMQLQDAGALLKDVQKGLVDFYWMRGAELAFLCWHLGEDRIKFWHGLEDGFAGRQPLAEGPHA
jgi:hypothetical protein